MKARFILAAFAVALAVGCSSGEVKAEAVDDFQKAGLKPGETVEKATGGSVEGER